MRSLQLLKKSAMTTAKKSQDASHLLLIVASLLAVVFAGTYADASPSSEMKFARSEIERAESLLSDLNERALGETDPANVALIGKKLVVLDQRLNDARESLTRATKAPKNPMAQEDLRASVMILDEASNRALNAALDADSRGDQTPTTPEMGREVIRQVTSSK